MDPQLRIFARQWLRLVVATLVPVVLTAFVTIPWNLGKLPGERNVAITQGERHMT